MNEQEIKKATKKVMKEMGYEVLKEKEFINSLDLRTFDEVVEDNLNYWNVGDLPVEYIDLNAMVEGDNDYIKLGDMYWKIITFFDDDIEELKENGIVKGGKMRIDLEFGGMIMTTNCTFYNAGMLIIDEKENSIDVSDENGMMIGMIYYDNSTKEITMNKYDSHGRLTGDIVDIIINGKLVYKLEE